MSSSFIETTERLIAKREKLEGGSVKDIEYPEGFIEACDLVYKMDGTVYMACEVFGCWVFSTVDVVFDSGPTGVVIATGEPVRFHIPSLTYAKDDK